MGQKEINAATKRLRAAFEDPGESTDTAWEIGLPELPKVPKNGEETTAILFARKPKGGTA